MAKVQRVYTKEFKEEAVKLAQSSGKPVAQIARELGVSDSAIMQFQKLSWIIEEAIAAHWLVS